MELHEYQKKAINFAIKKQATYMMMDLGLGKTAVAIKAVERSRYPALVLAPLRVALTTWPDEVKKWSNMKCTILHGKDKNLRLKLDRHIYVLNYEGLKWFYKACANKQFRLRKMFFVFDESSMLKDRDTQRFRLLKKMRPLMSDYRMMLSATPAPNSLHELWAQYFFLDGGKSLGTAFTPFKHKFFDQDPYSYVINIKDGSKDKIYSRIKYNTYRLDRKDYSSVPDIIYNNLVLELPFKLRDRYEALETDFILNIDEHIVEATNAAVLVNKLRQFLQGAMYVEYGESYKVLHDLKIQLLKELYDTAAGQPILCATQYRFEIEMIQKYFNMRLPVIAGGTNATESTQLIRKWNQSKIPILLCHPASISHGVNLQAGGHNLVWLGLPWSLEQYQQLNGRLHRQGQTKQVVVNNIVFKDTIDEVLVNVLARKDATQQDLLLAMKRYGGQI